MVISNRIYQLYTAVVGHSNKMDRIRNIYSDNEVTIHPSAEIGRRTELHGNIDIKSDVSISWNCMLQGDIDIGKGTNINGKNKLIGNISVGKYCAIAPRARIRTTAHPIHHPAMQSKLYNKIGATMHHTDTQPPVNIGNDVWICSDTKILSGVTVGNGAIIGANSVVVEDVEPYSLVAGNPAEHKKYRFDQNIRSQLQEICWWDWSDEMRRKNKDFFEANLNKVESVYPLITD